MKRKMLVLVLTAGLTLSACVPVSTAGSPATPATNVKTELASQVQLIADSASPLATPMGKVKAQPPATAAASQAQRPATPAAPQGQGGGAPPAAAIAACKGKSAGNACEFTWEKGTESGVCELVQDTLACSPQRDAGAAHPTSAPSTQGGDAKEQAAGAGYNIEQAISDKAQGMTIAFDALAFLTGDLGSDSFFPPGKVADFWGFQYLRDNDTSEMGHAGDFLTSAALNVLNTLTSDQRAKLVALAKNQVASINEYGYDRFVLMQAFRRLADGNLPTGTTGLSEDAVKAYSAKLYLLDGEISFARAELMGEIITAMHADQRAYLDAMTGKGMLDWPDVTEPEDMRSLDRDVKVAVMTYAADLFSWYSGAIEADVYFCPERHGTYFGSFYLKDRRAMDDPTYAIPTALTGDMGDELLGILTADQAKLVTNLVDTQRSSLEGIVAVRRQVATELRKFKDGETTSRSTVLGLMKQYGELDGTIVYNLARNFVEVSRTLSAEQKAKLTTLRTEMLGDLVYPTGAYLYSQPISMPEIPNTDFLFD